MQCPVCNAENSAQAVFCEKCGARITKKPPPIEVEVADSSDEPEVRVRRRPTGSEAPSPSRESDRPRRRRVVVEDDERPSGGAIVPYRNPLALFAYYCVFLGFIIGIGAITAVVIYAQRTVLSEKDINFGKMVINIGFIAGMIVELAAFLMGIFGLLYVRSHPTARGTGHAILGVILGPALIIVLLAALIFMRSWLDSLFPH